jgi:NAD+ synthase (glutamine-hydrolysing)
MADATTTLRIALAQVNTTVGDLEGNSALVTEWAGRARDAGAQLVLFPEQTLTGYPAEDLWLKRHFVDAAQGALERIAGELEGIIAMVGLTEANSARHNTAAIVAGGEIRARYRKMLLPNYEVFDERRYFDPGDQPALIEVGGVLIGLTICEDIWYPGPPASVEALAGASLIVNPAASPYHRGKGAYREEMLAARAAETGAAFAMCCLVGGQDELVFDGHSVVVSASGEVLARGRQFEEDLVVCDLELPLAATTRDERPEGPTPEVPVLARFDPTPVEGHAEATLAPLLGEEAEVYAALVLGLRDYTRKNGFERVLIALSGGIDSALVAVIAVDALGPDRVTCVSMPSPHSSEETQADARAIAANLGAELIEIPIEPAMAVYQDLLHAPSQDGGTTAGRRFRAEEPGAGSVDLAAENVQARIRGNLVMAISNRTGWLVLTTGNKSELSVGYATLYGDMAGGFAVIKDVPKTLVYEVSRHVNTRAGRAVIPASVFDRAPSAELRPDQTDQDTLPPYPELDAILQAYVEEDRGVSDLVARGFLEETVRRVVRMVDVNEYKRRQGPIGVKITPRAFGRDWRLPIVNRFRER